MRASDAEREQCVGALRRAAGEGRLDLEELDERMGRAYGAKTRGELSELLADLPRPAPPPVHVPPAHPQYAVVPLPARSNFRACWVRAETPDDAAHDFLKYAAPALYGRGYQLVNRSPGRVLFARTHRPGWTIAFAVLLFPIGLLALLATDYQQISIDFIDEGDHTVMEAQGIAPQSLKRWFWQLGG